MANRWISVMAAGLATFLWTPTTPAQPGSAPFPPTQGAAFAPMAPRSLVGGQDSNAPAVNFEPTNSHPADTTPDRYTPYMLGDLVLPVATYMFDLKVAEGNSPRPMDRIFVNYNYYNNLGKTGEIGPVLARIGPLLQRIDLHRYVFGVEKTFMDGKASVQVRFPFFTIDAEAREGAPDAGLSATYFGNISAIAKLVLKEDPATGSLISGGILLSVPTAQTRVIDPGPGTIAYIEPFVGAIVSRDNFFIQGFGSFILPIVRPESIVMFADLGVGYFVYRDTTCKGLIRSLAPTAEVHLTVPIRQADPQVVEFSFVDNIHIDTIVDFTVGATVEFSNRSTLGLGVCVPVTGPRPWNIEALAQFNFHF